MPALHSIIAVLESQVFLTSPVENAINNTIEIISGGNASASASTRLRKSIVNNLYDRKTDAAGNVTLTPKPGSDKKLKLITDKTKEINLVRKQLKEEEELYKSIGMPTAEDAAKLKELRARLPKLTDELEQLLGEAPAATGSVQTQGAQSGKSALDAALEAAQAK